MLIFVQQTQLPRLNVLPFYALLYRLTLCGTSTIYYVYVLANSMSENIHTYKLQFVQGLKCVYACYVGDQCEENIIFPKLPTFVMNTLEHNLIILLLT